MPRPGAFEARLLRGLDGVVGRDRPARRAYVRSLTRRRNLVRAPRLAQPPCRRSRNRRDASVAGRPGAARGGPVSARPGPMPIRLLAFGLALSRLPAACVLRP